MSLDVFLHDKSGTSVFEANITHNLGKMASEAGIYRALWRPEEIGIETAGQIVPILENGLALMATNRRRFEAFDAGNGWGKWVDFVPWCASYLDACREHPDAAVSAYR